MKECNQKPLASYFLMLEQLRSSGRMDNFSPEDLKKLTQDSLKYFKKFNMNRERYEEGTNLGESGVSVTLISKYQLSMMDYKEEYNTVNIGTQKTKVHSPYRLNATVEDIEIEESEDHLQQLSISEKYLGRIEIDEMYICGDTTNKDNLSSYLFREIMQTIGDAYSNEPPSFVAKTDIHTILQSAISKALEEVGVGEREDMEGIIEEMVPIRGLMHSMYSDKISNEFFNSVSKKSVDIPSSFSFNGDSLKIPAIPKEEFRKELKTLVAESLKPHIERRTGVTIHKDLGSAQKTEDFYTALKERLTEEISEFDFEHTLNTVAESGRKKMEDLAFRIAQKMQEGRNSHLIDTVKYNLGGSPQSDNRRVIEMAEEKLAKKEECSFRIKTYPRNKEGIIKTIPIKKGKKFIASEIQITDKVVDKEMPHIYNVRAPEIREIDHILNLKDRRASIKIEEVRAPWKLTKNSKRNNSRNYYTVTQHTTNLDSLGFEIPMLDEADSGDRGNTALVIRGFAQNAKNILIATGTPMAGRAKDIVPLLAYAGGMSANDIVSNEKEFLRQCSVNEIRSRLISGIVLGISNDSVYREVEDAFGTYDGAERENIASLMAAAVSSILVTLRNEKIIDDKTAEQMEINTEAKSLSQLFDAMLELAKEGGSSVSTRSLLESALFADPYLTTSVPGISAPGIFATLVKSFGGSATVISREGLLNLKESVKIRDYDTHKSVLTSSYEEAEEEYASMNYVSARLTQSAIDTYVWENFIPHTLGMLTKNFDLFLKAFTDKNTKAKENLSRLKHFIMRNRGEEFQEGELLTAIQRSTSTSNDGLSSLYREYLNNNGRRGQEEGLKDKLFDTMLELYTDFLQVEISQGDRKYLADIDYERINTFIPESFKSLGETISTGDIISSLEKGYPNGYIFSVEVEMCPPHLRYLIEPDKDGKHIPYRVSLAKKEDVITLLDIYATSKGALSVHKKTTEAGESAVMASGRVYGTVIDTLTAIHNTLETKSGDAQSVVVNNPMGAAGSIMSLGKLLDRINEDRQNGSLGTETTLVQRVEMEAKIRQEIEKGKTLTLATNYNSAARGLSLAAVDVMHITGAMDTISNALQFLERQFSHVRRDADITMFTGGYSQSMYVIKEEDRKSLVDVILGGKGVTEKEMEESLSLFLGEEDFAQDTMTGMDVSLLPSAQNKSSEKALVARGVAQLFMNGKSSNIGSATKKVTGEIIGERSSPVLLSESFEEKAKRFLLDSLDKKTKQQNVNNKTREM